MMGRPGAQRYARTHAVTDRSHSSNVTVWLKPDEFQALDAIARGRDMSRTAVVRELVLCCIAAQHREAH